MQIHVYSRACRPLKDLIILWYVCNLCGKYRIVSVHVVCDKSESWVYILSVRAFSSFAPIAKVRVTPVHTFPDWQECTSAYGNKHYFGDFQALGCQSGSGILCAVSLYNGETTAGMTEAQQVLSPFYMPFERFCHIHAMRSCQPGKAWLSVNHAFAIGGNELNALTESTYFPKEKKKLWAWMSDSTRDRTRDLECVRLTW